MKGMLKVCAVCYFIKRNLHLEYKCIVIIFYCIQQNWSKYLKVLSHPGDGNWLLNHSNLTV